ncbi:flagellin [Gemmobacter serpentinus]|uniref:flagellin n=1 Tax=Gemmobacter serpentinus TaxID=2652247 RepID=UPI00124D8BFA|nr:flagellin [Gemmobacter serpentinus]
MTLLSIGDLAQSLMLRQNLGFAKSRMNILTQEMASGVKSDLAAALRGNTGTLAGLNAAMTRIEGFGRATTELSLEAEMMQAALGAFSDLATSLALPLQAAQTAGAAGFEALAQDARNKFNTAISLLNSESAGRALFSGAASDLRPLPQGEDVLAMLGALVAGESTMSVIRDRVEQWFDDAAGYAALYQGAEASGSIAVSPTERSSVAITAMDPAIRASLKALALAALSTNGATALDDEGRIALAAEAGARLGASEQARADLRAGLGVVQARLEAAATGNTAEKTALGIARAALIEADPYETATELTAAQTRLETIYAITSRLATLSLASYLR